MILFSSVLVRSLLFFVTDPATTDIYTLSLHDALPISSLQPVRDHLRRCRELAAQGKWSEAGKELEDIGAQRSEEHTSELQSLRHLVCRLLLEKKKKNKNTSRDADIRFKHTGLTYYRSQ